MNQALSQPTLIEWELPPFRFSFNEEPVTRSSVYEYGMIDPKKIRSIEERKSGSGDGESYVWL